MEQTDSNQKKKRRSQHCSCHRRKLVRLVPCCRYLEQLVAGEEVGGGLQDGRHGLGQFLVHRPAVVARVRLRPEDKLVVEEEGEGGVCETGALHSGCNKSSGGKVSITPSRRT